METSVITQQNILNPHKRIVATTKATHSSEILDTLLIAKGFEVAFYKNSEFMPEPFEIKQGDIINIVFIPQGGKSSGKSVISLVAMIGLAVFAPQLGYSLGTYVMGGAPLTAFQAGIFTAGVMMAGGLLVNAVLAPNIPTSSLNNELATSSTYSWSSAYNKFTQGEPVPVVFGTHKVTPPLLSKYIESIEDMQYFNGLYALNDGEIKSISNIKINDEPIENFDNVTVEIRYGTLNQALINSFDNTRSDKAVSKKLDTNYAIATTDGDGVIALCATLCFPRGLYHVNDSGNLENYSVKIVLEYSTDGTTWTRFGGDTEETGFWYYVNYGWGEDNNQIISKYTSYNGTFIEDVSAIPSDAIRYQGGSKYQEWYYTPSYTNPYTTVTASSSSTFRKTYRINNLTSAEYQIRVKFYEEPLSSSRYASTCYFEYLTQEIGDDFIYPTTALLAIRALATDQLSGTDPVVTCNISANSNNPSLVCQKVLTDCGENTENLLDSFEVWEEYCTQKELYFNGVLDTSVAVRKTLDMVGLIGRGSVQQFGSYFGVIIDKKEVIPTQGFTVGIGNILKDSLEISYLSLTDRANVIACTYYDAENDYNATVIQKSLTGYDSVSEDNKVEISLPGCTSRTQAIRHCVYQLKNNRLITQSAKLKVDKDGLWSQYGDIVSLSHPILGYGESGRVTSCTSTQVVLDQEVKLESGKMYYIQLRDDENNISYHDIENTQTTTNTLTFIEELENNTFEKYDNYQFGEYGKANKLYRLIRIATNGDAMSALSLIEYNESVYDDMDDDFNVIDVSSSTLSNLFATDYIRYGKDGKIETVMQLSWSGVSLYYTLKYKKSSEFVYTSIKVYKSSFDVVVEDVSYDIIIQNQSGKNVSLTYQVVGKISPPDPITNITVKELQDDFQVSWDYENYPIDFLCFEVYVNGILFSSQKTQVCSIPIISSKQIIRVYAVDTTNNKSMFVETALIAAALEDIEAINVLYENNQQNIYWLKITSLKTPILYEVRKGSVWENGQVISTTSETMLKAVTNGQYMVKAFYTLKNGQKIYSTTSAVVIVDGDILPKNVIASFNEHETWSGVKTNTFIYDDYLTLESNSLFDDILDFDAISNFDFPNNTVHAIGSYESTNIVNLGAPQSCKISVYFDAYAQNMIDSFDDILDFDSILNFDGYTADDFSINAQISISQDGLSFGTWKLFIPGDYLGQCFKMRLVLITINPNIRPIVTSFSFSIDMPDRFEQGTITTPATLTFSKPFNMIPYTQITLSNALAGDDIELTNENENSFTLNIKNGGNNVVRTCNYYSSGY